MKIAVLLSRVPYPLEKGDKLRAFHQIRELSASHEIFLYALNDGTLHPKAKEKLSGYCKAVNIYHLPTLIRFWNAFLFFLRFKPLQCGYFYNKKIKKEIQESIRKEEIDHIYCQLIRTASYAIGMPHRKTLDFQDVFSKGIDRMIPKSAWWKRGLLRAEYKRIVRFEHDMLPLFDNCTIITQVDKSLIQHPRAKEIVVVPNGVDLDYYQIRQKEKKIDLIFTGNMAYLPNIDAATYICKEIVPSLKKKYPNIKVAICGANPSPKVLALQSGNVTVTGWVDDMRDYYSQARIFIAPMHLGTGLQNKLLEAMAMQIPCITSPLAAMPLHAETNKELLVCNSTLGFVDAIDHLLTDSEYYHEIATNGFAFVKKNYNWTQTTEILNKLITKAQI